MRLPFRCARTRFEAWSRACWQSVPGGALTTGADLLRGTKSQVEIPFGFRVGMRVRHPRYGTGTVVEIGGGLGRLRSVTVAFEHGSRSETFVAANSPLQPIGTR